MKFKDSIAAKCRYGEEALRAFGEDAELIWECSEDNYQGSANILLYDYLDYEFIHYEWTYGSCSGCDDWESRELTSSQIVEEMLRDCNRFHSIEDVNKYLKLEDAELSRSTPLTNDSVPGRIRVLSGGAGEEFKAMRDAFWHWQNSVPYERQCEPY